MEIQEQKQRRGARSNQKLKILYLAKFITGEKSNELIRKIEHLASKHDAAMLQRQVYVAGRVKAMNRDIMENVDAIHNAIAHNSKNWIMAFGDGAKIIGPKKLVEEVRGEINRLMAQCSK